MIQNCLELPTCKSVAIDFEARRTLSKIWHLQNGIASNQEDQRLKRQSAELSKAMSNILPVLDKLPSMKAHLQQVCSYPCKLSTDPLKNN